MENENEFVAQQDTDTTENDELELELEPEEDVEALKKEIETLKAQKEHWRKKAAQPVEKTEQPKTETTPSITEEVIEVKILKAQGVSDELITQLKKIARVNETSIIEAQSDPYFIAFKEKIEAEAKKEKASLPASRNSGSVRKSKDFTSTGLSEEEHKQLWKDRMGL